MTGKSLTLFSRFIASGVRSQEAVGIKSDREEIL